MSIVRSIVIGNLIKSGWAQVPVCCNGYLGAKKLGASADGSTIFAATFYDTYTSGRRVVIYKVNSTEVFIVPYNTHDYESVYFDSNRRAGILSAARTFYVAKKAPVRHRRYWR